MGVVYLARAEGAAGFVKPVVVKRILPDLTGDDSMARMFVREARILSNLQHPGIVGVIDFGEEDQAYIMVLEYVHGYHLGRWHRFARDKRGDFPTLVAMQVMIRVLEALHYAHTRTRQDGKPLGIVHRDISPSNIFLDTEGHVKILDFGIARMSGDTAEYKTQDLTLKGKLAYLAPELFHGGAPTVQSDIYACGVVLHELLIGRNEFRGREMSETVNRVLTHSPTSVEATRTDAPRGLDLVIQRALSKKLQERWQTAADFAQALRELRGVTEEEADSQLIAAVQADFFGALPEALNIEPLDVLEQAWREAQITEPIDSDRPAAGPRTSDRPTELARPPAAATEHALPAAELPAPKGSRGGRSAILAAMIAVLVVAGGVFAWQMQQTRATPSQVVVVRDRVPDFGAAGPDDVAPPDPEGVTDDVDAGAATEPEDGEETGTSEGTSSARRGGRNNRRSGNDITRVFAQQQARIQGCFLQHSAELSGSPMISIRFSIDAAGVPQSVDLMPPALGPTPLGRCLTNIARATRFGRQQGPMTFRIPITARRAN